jgi:hypothetical protein
MKKFIQDEEMSWNSVICEDEEYICNVCPIRYKCFTTRNDGHVFLPISDFTDFVLFLRRHDVYS